MASDSDTIRKDIEDLRVTIEKLTNDVSMISRSMANDIKDQAGRVAGDLRDGARTITSEIGSKGIESAEAIKAAVLKQPIHYLLMAFGAGLLLAQIVRKR